ncbi:MAG: 5'-nucleotidase C-terminal domain-containing protein, partial [Culicoidibacterales bacterium]
TFVDQTQPDLLFDAGDALQGLPLSNESQGMMMLEAMNAIGYDAMAVGNHEFDFGYAQAQTYVNEANFPILASNILDKMKNESAFEQTTMFELYGIQVGVVGVATPETAEKTHPDNVVDVTFQDPYTTTQAAVDQLEADGADIIIALSHLGLDASSAERADLLAEQVEGLDLIIDGHSHTKLTEPLVVNGIPIVQTGEYLNNVGVIELTYDTATDEVTIAATLEATKDNLANLAEDESLSAIVAKAQVDFDERTNIPVFENSVLFDGARENVRTRETNLGNMITDAMANYGQTGGFKNRTDFAVTNGGGIRADLNVGTVTLKDIITVLPFGNQISQIPLTGAEIMAMYEKSVGVFPATNGGFLHSSKDIRVNYNVANETGERVLNIAIADETGTFQPLDEAKTYYVAMPDFLSVGGDGYTMLAGKAREEGGTLDSVVADFTKATSFDSTTYAWDNGPERLLATNVTANEPVLADPETTLDLTNQTVNFGQFSINYDATFVVKQTEEVITFLNIMLEPMMTLDLTTGTLTISDNLAMASYVLTADLFSYELTQPFARSQAVTNYQIDLTTQAIIVDGQTIGTYTGTYALAIAADGSVTFDHPTQVGLPEVELGPEGDVTPEVTPEVETPEVETPEVDAPAQEGFGPEGDVTPEVTPEVVTPEVETPEADAPAQEGFGPEGDVTPEVTPEVVTPEVTPEAETPEGNPEETLPDTGMAQAEMIVALATISLMTSAVVLIKKRNQTA